MTGVRRTKGFIGTESEITLYNEEKGNYRTGGGDALECGMAALRFATDLFSFRKNANRIFVNFTDEPNQNNKIDRFSVESLLTDWDTTLGTIHTVYSASKNSDKNESNRLMSEYTGGTRNLYKQQFHRSDARRPPRDRCHAQLLRGTHHQHPGPHGRSAS